MTLMQRALSLIYPDQCVLCGDLVDQAGALCGACWLEMPFLHGHGCDLCGASLVGDGDGYADLCDDCLTIPRPWDRGRAAIAYRGAARRLVLGLKHGDRTDLVPTAATWMAQAGRDVLKDQPLLVPVPIFWTRLVRRRYNQAAELARRLAMTGDHSVAVDALVRTRATKKQDGMTVDERFQNLSDSIEASETGANLMAGRRVLLIDDVMTSGATLAASTTACHEAGATHVSVLVLARAEKAP